MNKQHTHKTAVPRISLISITTLKATTSRIDSIVICAEFCTNQRDISNTTYYILPVIAIFGLIRLHLVCAFITVLFFSLLFSYSLLSQRLIAFMIILVCGCTQIKCTLKSIDACDVCVFFCVSSWKFHSPPLDSMSFVVATNTSQL